MADIATVIQNLREDGEFIEASNLPDVQFSGPRNQRYLGAELLPEQLRESNQYDEEDFHLLDLIAADVDAYSPPPFMGVFARAGAFNVRMGDSGLATQMPTKTYSDIIKLLRTSASMERVANAILRWNEVITAAMLTYNERQRWNAIVVGEVVRRIAQTEETIPYPEAAGQRSVLVNAWSDEAYDPMADLFAVRTRATSLGYSGVRRIITTRASLDILLNNPHVQRRIGQVSIVGDQEYIDYADESRLRGYLSANGLPSIETYDEVWRSQTGTGRYLPEGVMVFVYNTGRTIEDIIELEEEIYVPDNQGAGLGYCGIGTPAGHEDLGPGRWQDLVYNGGSRPNIFGEGVQKSLPVFSDPSAFQVYSSIR
jgi:hypothetical protein